MAHQRNFWIPVICGAIILTIGIGARQSFGIFQKPIAADLNVGRELWSFSIALALLLMGVFAPFAGNLADRFGTARTVGAGGALYVAGMLMIAMAAEGVMLTVGNALAGIGMAAAGFGPILGRSDDGHRVNGDPARLASRRPAAHSVSSRSCRSLQSCKTASTIGIRRCSCLLPFR